MLQMCIDMKLFLYGMIAAGVAGVWCLFWSNHFYNKAIRDLGRKDKPRGRWTAKVLEELAGSPVENMEAFIRVRLAAGRQAGCTVGRLRQSAAVCICACAVLFAAGGYGIFRYRYELYVLGQYGALAGAVALGLLMLRYCMNMQEKEELLVDGWRDYFENSGHFAVRGADGEARIRIPAASEHAQKETFPATEQERARFRRKKDKRAAGQEHGGRNADAKSAGLAMTQERKTDQESPFPGGRGETGQEQQGDGGRERTDSDAQGRQARLDRQVAQIEKGIREAAASDSRFAGVLTPEEEKLFREVIREYLS